jgi:hypothetical protein
MSGDQSLENQPTRVRFGHWGYDLLWLMLLFGGTAWWCLTAGERVGLTFDEPLYLTSGLECWRDGDYFKLTIHGVMPLPVDAATLPLYWHERQTGQKIAEPLDYLTRARMVNLLWLWLLLVSALRLGRCAAGPWAGRLASGLLAADPNFLAHASLATTDMCITATLMAFTRAVYAGRSGGWWKRLLLPGLWYGVAVLAKLSALLYGGLILVAIEATFRLHSGRLARPAGAGLGAWSWSLLGAAVRSVLAIGTVIAIGIVIAGVYCWYPESGKRPFAYIAQAMPPTEPLRPAYIELAKKVDRVPYALATFSFQWWHTSRGRPTFLDGTFYPDGCWFFYPAIIAMKLPIPVILLGLAAACRPRAAVNALSFTAVVLLLNTLTANLQIGVRLVLPIIAIGYVAVATSVIRGYGLRGAWMGLAAVAVMAATSAWIWPHGLCYLNQLSGGSSGAQDRVCDSNCDWGQGLPDLAAWHEAHNRPRIAVWYFGTDPRVGRPPFERIVVEPLPLSSGEDFRAAVGPRVLAVGATVVGLHPDATPAKLVAIEYLRGRVPLDRTPTFTLYDFRGPDGPPRR